MTTRKTGRYFDRAPGCPPPVTASLTRRVAFNEVDVMGIAWHGRYAAYFEEVSTELRRICGLTYQAFRDAAVAAPIVELHIDYRRPLFLDETVTLKAALIWTEAARLNTEYEIVKENGARAATGYTVQLFTDLASGEPLMASPELLETSRRRWMEGNV